MKKIICLLISVLILLSLCSCGENTTTDDVNSSAEVTDTSDATDDSVASADETTAYTSGSKGKAEGSFPYNVEDLEYTLYYNIFYNEMGDSFEGEEFDKTGTFAIIYDKFNDVTRYYVWGYRDETKCCDWQWEFIPSDVNSLPSPGSLIEVTGTFTGDESALDGYWLTDTTLTVKEEYTHDAFDVDMAVMSGTLERVQIINMLNYKEDFEGKTVSAYGRVYGNNTIQHPYYDSCFELDVVLSDGGALPAIDTYVLVKGTFTGGALGDAVYEETSAY